LQPGVENYKSADKKMTETPATQKTLFSAFTD